MGAAKEERQAGRGSECCQTNHPTTAGFRGRGPRRRRSFGLALADELAPFVTVSRLGAAQHLGGARDLRPVAPMVGTRCQPSLEAGAQLFVRRLLAERDQPVAGDGRSVAVRWNWCLAHASGSSLTSYTTAIRMIFRSFPRFSRAWGASGSSGNAPGHRAGGARPTEISRKSAMSLSVARRSDACRRPCACVPAARAVRPAPRATHPG